MLDPAEIDRRFTYHPPDEQTKIIHANWRILERKIAEEITALATMAGDSREISLALTKLEEMTFWIHAHIARNITQKIN